MHPYHFSSISDAVCPLYAWVSLRIAQIHNRKLWLGYGQKSSTHQGKGKVWVLPINWLNKQGNPYQICPFKAPTSPAAALTAAIIHALVHSAPTEGAQSSSRKQHMEAHRIIPVVAVGDSRFLTIGARNQRTSRGIRNQLRAHGLLVKFPQTRSWNLWCMASSCSSMGCQWLIHSSLDFFNLLKKSQINIFHLCL